MSFPKYQRDYRHHVGPGLQGVVTLGILNAMEQRRLSNESVSNFPAMDIFGAALKRVCYSGPEDRHDLLAELVQFQPEVEAQWLSKKIGLRLEFNTYFARSRHGIQALYKFDRQVSASDDNYAVLSQMINYAVDHWANEVSALIKEGDRSPQFPPERHASIKIDKTDCSYYLFGPVAMNDERDDAPEPGVTNR